MIRLLVDRSVAVLIALIALTVFGLVSYITLPRESSPDITIPVVLVTTPYIGVSPEDVESLVTIPIENELAGLQDLKEISSTSAEGISIVSVEFEAEVNIDEALQSVRDRVSRARADLPDDAEESTVTEISFSDIPILLVNIAGSVDEQVLKGLGEDLEDEVTRIPGVLEATLSGGLDRELQVQIDPVRLSHYGLSLNDVIGAIGNENVNIPGGDVDAGQATFLLRTPNEFRTADDVAGVAIKRVGDRPVFVRDVASVVDAFADRETMARMNGAPSVTLAVKKRPGSNIIAVSDEVKRIVAEQVAAWPQGVSYKILADESTYIRDQVSELQNNLLTALILVVGVLLVFMGLRSSLFVGLGIPLSLLLSFIALDFLGFTLNMMVLFSLILALGMLVDNGIVITENIYRLKETGLSNYEAAVRGAQEVALPVATSTLTTVAAFFPLVFWGGIMGEFMSFLPKTLIIALTASLITALVALPPLASYAMKTRRTDQAARMNDRELGWFMRGYRTVLNASIRFRYVSAAAMTVLFFASFVAFGVLGNGVEFFPATEPDRATISVRAPDGTDLDTTDAIVRRIEAILAAEENVDVYVSEVGVNGSGDPFAAGGTPNQARISVDFLKHRNSVGPGEKARIENTDLTLERLRIAVAEIPGAEVAVNKLEMGPPVEKPIRVLVSGEDLHTVGQHAEEIRRRIAAVPGVTDLTDDYRVGRPELQLRIDRGAAKRIGVSSAEIGSTVRNAIAGAVASKLRDGEEEHDIVVQLAPADREDLQSVLGLRVAGREDTSPDSFPVPMSSVARYELAGGTGSVRHIDQDLVVTIEGEVLDGFSEYEVQQAVAALLPELAADGIHLELAGSNTEQEESMIFLGRALLIAMFLIAMILVAQFNSVTDPLIIVGTVFLSMIGVLWGLILTGTPFGVIMTGIGVVSLAGVVVNNAIVLIDYVNQLRSEGMPVREALLEAGLTRLRPVLLTAGTTVLGLIPMALGVSFDFFKLKWLVGGASAAFWGPMAVAVIFGLTFATVLTLVMVPTFYSITEDVRAGYWWLHRKLYPIEAPVAEPAAKLLLASVVGALAFGVDDARAVTLEEAFAAAETSNVDLRLSGEQTVQAESQVGQAWSLVSPKVSAQGGLTLNQLEIAFSPTDGLPPELQELVGEQEPIVIQQKSQWSGNFNISQPIFDAEALPLLRGAYRLADAARADERGARQQIRAGVARAYLGLAAARAAEQLAADAVATAEHQLDLATRLRGAGLSDRRALVQAELGVSRARRDHASAREQMIAAQEAFTRVTGLPQETPLEPVAMTAELPGSPDAALEIARSNRPDVEAALLRERAARLATTSKHLGWLPDVNASFTLLYSEATGFSGKHFQWTAGVNANWLLWDGGYRLADSRRTASQQRSATYAVERAQASMAEEVRVAFERHTRADAAVAAVEREVALATESLALAEAGYAAGSATWLDVEQAELGLRMARLSELNERVGRDLAAIDLRRAMGTL
jgi:multidrug efflux pump